MTSHDAVILAAGGSHRLGRPKQLLRRDGETLVARAARLVAHTRPTRLLVVLGAHEEAIRSALGGMRVETVLNQHWEAGMGTSLRLAATVLSGGDRPVLVTVVDQPALTAVHLDALLAAHDVTRDVVTGYGAVRGVPVVLRPSTLARASELEGDEGLRRLWANESPRVVTADDLGNDIDTPDDVARAVARGWLDA